MSTVNPTIFRHSRYDNDPVGARLHRFTVDEYHCMKAFGVFPKDDPVELLDGRLYIKLDEGPPYGVPLGIPSEVIAGPDVEPYPQRRFTVEEYHRLMDSCALRPTLRTELVEGWVIEKMVRGARHDATIQRVARALGKRLGRKWEVRIQMGITMDGGEPEPDIAVVPGPIDLFEEAHPRPHDVELVVEVSDTTLSLDRGTKARDYARNGIRRYWIVNVIARQMEEYTDPTGPTDQPKFRSRKIYRRGDSIAITAGEKKIKAIPVNEFFGSI